MNRIILMFAMLSFGIGSFAQATEKDKLIELGKAYKDFMFRNEPPKGFTQQLQANIPQQLQPAARFIAQTITTNNQLLKDEYLTLPDSATLKYIYIITDINHNVREENPKDNNALIDSLKATNVSKNELVDNYYGVLFSGVGNKIEPFNFSKVDFQLKNYNLSNDVEKGIFFFSCMDLCGMSIWGYMNVPKPPNTAKAYSYIKKFPKFNGMKYYQYTDFSFPDFEMQLDKDNGKESYKGFYLNKYYNTLIYHLVCLKQEGGSEKDINDLLLGSILKQRNLYKYSKSKDLLEKLFKTYDLN